MDLVVYSSVLPREGETVFGNSFETFLGGKGANQAVAASRLGSKVSFIGKVGTDSFGQFNRSVFVECNNDSGSSGKSGSAGVQNSLHVSVWNNFIIIQLFILFGICYYY